MATVLRRMHFEHCMYMFYASYVMYVLDSVVNVVIVLRLICKTKMMVRFCYEFCDGSPSHLYDQDMATILPCFVFVLRSRVVKCIPGKVLFLFMKLQQQVN